MAVNCGQSQLIESVSATATKAEKRSKIEAEKETEGQETRGEEAEKMKLDNGG